MATGRPTKDISMSADDFVEEMKFMCDTILGAYKALDKAEEGLQVVMMHTARRVTLQVLDILHDEVDNNHVTLGELMMVMASLIITLNQDIEKWHADFLKKRMREAEE